MDAATEPAVSAQDAAVEDRRKKLELWKAQREAEKAAAKAGGKRGAAGAAGAEITSSTRGTRDDALSGAMSRTFGTPVTNRVAALSLKSTEKTGDTGKSASAAINKRASSSAHPPVRRSAAATSATKLAETRAGPAPVAPSAVRTAEKLPTARSASRTGRPAPPTKKAPVRSVQTKSAPMVIRGGSRKGSHTTTHDGQKAQDRKGSKGAEGRKEAGETEHCEVQQMTTVDMDEACLHKDIETGEECCTEENVVELAAKEGTAEEGEDLLAYLMPIADDSVEEEPGEEQGSNQEVGGADGEQVVSGLQSVEATLTSEAMDVGTPQVRKVLNSSDIFTPESGTKASPAVSITPSSGGENKLIGSTISPCVLAAEAEKRERKSAAKRRKSSMLAFTLTPGSGPGQEGQLTPVSRSAAARAAKDHTPLLLSQPAISTTPRSSSPNLPPVPIFSEPAAAAEAPKPTSPTVSRSRTPRGIEEAVVSTPGSGFQRTGLGGTPRRIKSPFPRAPGLSGGAARVGMSPAARRVAQEADRAVCEAERIASAAIGALRTPGGSLWQDKGGISGVPLGREAGEDDALALAPEEQGQEENTDAVVIEDDEVVMQSPARVPTTPGRAAYTPGGRPALSPIDDGEEEEDEAAELGGRKSLRSSLGMPQRVMLASDEITASKPTEAMEHSGEMLEAESSTPGKEYLPRTNLGGTPLRRAMLAANVDLVAKHPDPETEPTTPGGSIITRVPVRATSAQKEEHGSHVILTPVRRSARKQKPWSVDDISSVGEQLASCGYAYQPNKHVVYPEDYVDPLANTEEDDDNNDEGESKWGEFETCGQTGVARPKSEHKRKAATPGHESAKKLGKELNPATEAEAEAQGTPDVVTKRRILRAKLAEADSPLASPKAVV